MPGEIVCLLGGNASGKTTTQVAQEFGVNVWNLRDWKRQYRLVAKPVDAPMLTSKVTINPASHCAGSCLSSGYAEEKVNCWTLL